MSIKISSLCLGVLNNFVYFIKDEVTSHTFIVDPSCEQATLEQHLIDNECELKGILLTHSHPDHIDALLGLVEKYRIPTYITRPEFRLGRARVKSPTYIKEGDQITLGESVITVYESPGHTVGGVCFQVDNALITGDTLFINGCGRCDFYESDIDAMWQSLQRLKQFPDEWIVYSGHDYGAVPFDTLGNQKRSNPYLLIENKDFFVAFRMELQKQYRHTPFQPSSREEMKEIQLKHGFTETKVVKQQDSAQNVSQQLYTRD